MENEILEKILSNLEMLNTKVNVLATDLSAVKTDLAEVKLEHGQKLDALTHNQAQMLKELSGLKKEQTVMATDLTEVKLNTIRIEHTIGRDATASLDGYKLLFEGMEEVRTNIAHIKAKQDTFEFNLKLVKNERDDVMMKKALKVFTAKES